MQVRLFLRYFVLFCVVTSTQAASQAITQSFNPPQQFIAQSLNWKSLDSNASNLCQGHFVVDPQVTSITPSSPAQTTVTHIQSDMVEEKAQQNITLLNKNVVVTQPGRKLNADHAIIYRSKKTGHINKIQFKGHVRYQTADNMLTCPYATINMQTKNDVFHQPIFRHHYTNASQKTENTGWGSALVAYRDKNQNVDLYHHVQFSPCNPLHPSWRIIAQHAKLNHKKHVFSAYNAVLTFYHIPIFYTPYLSFSMNQTRKSGFLLPKLGYDKDVGVHAFFPYYLNLAPNFDDTVTAGIDGSRGLYTANEFRFLTEKSQASFDVTWLPHDKYFAQFKQKTIDDKTVASKFIDLLNKSSANRYSINGTGNVRWTPKLSGSFNANYVSDDYFLQDISSNNLAGSIIANQLTNQAQINYAGTHFSASVLAQAYQTLHPLNSDNQNQYQRLPDLSDNYFYAFGHIVTLFNQNEMTNFMMPNNVFSPDSSKQNGFIINGWRMHNRTTLSMPLSNVASYLTPSIALDATQYWLKPTQAVGSSISSQSPQKRFTRTLPVMNVDSGLYFDKFSRLGKLHLQTTIAPELDYLYLPYKAQYSLPIFDTVSLPLTYDSLFTNGTFSGFDRVQNANQLTFGVHTSMYDSDNHAQLASLGVGVQRYFSIPSVSNANTLTPTALTAAQRYKWSPIISELSITPESIVSSSVDLNYDTYYNRIANTTFNISVNASARASLSASLIYTSGSTPQMKGQQYGTLALTLPLGPNLEALGYGNFDITDSRPIAVLAGFQLDTCCWALQAIVGSSYTGSTANNHNQYHTGIYFNLILKGLTSVDRKGLADLLKSNINGYTYE